MAESYYNSSLTGAQIEAVLLGAVRGDATQNKDSTWKARARSNIGAASDDAVAASAVRYDASQSLTDAQKQTARDNIGAASDSLAVKVISQSLTDSQKAVARSNISAVSADTFDGQAVKYSAAQSLTDAQKSTARNNIGAAAADALQESDRLALLLADVVPNTTAEVTMTQGVPTKITHKSGSTAIRTDTFTFSAATITESRVLNTGEQIVIVTDLRTLAVQSTYQT